MTVSKIGLLTLPLLEAGEPLEVILKLPGESCNLNCSYCYEKRQPSESNGLIGLNLLDALFQTLGNRPVSIGLHGGEPLLLGKARFRQLLCHLAKREPAPDARLQSNGVLLDDEWIDLFKNSPIDLTIGISHDGPGHLSSYRVNYKGSSNQSASDRALTLLDRAGLKYGVICVVSRSNIAEPECLIEFFNRFEGLSTLNFVPCFDYSVQSRDLRGKSGTLIRTENPTNSGSPGWAVTPLEFLQFLKKVWLHWQTTPNFIIEPFVSVIRSIYGSHPESCDFTAQKCGHIVTVYPDGRIIGCDEFESEIADLNVNVLDKSRADLGAAAFDRIVTTANSHLKKCQTCSHYASCGGGCIATRERYLGTQYYEDYCEYKKGLINFVREQTEVR